MAKSQIVTIHAAKTHLSKLIRNVLEGQEVIIARGDKPVAKLVALDDRKGRRVLGTARGLVKIHPKFDAPLEDFSDYQ